MKIFIDTSAWVALENKKDIHYNEAVTFRDEIKNRRYRLFTSNFILDETFTLCFANLGYEKTIECARRIRYLRDKGLLHVIRLRKTLKNLRGLYLKGSIKTNSGLLLIAQARR